MAEEAITLCTVRSTVPPAYRAEMAQWQREEHVPRLLGVPGYLGVQRFERLGDDCSFMNIWTMRSRAAFDSPEHDAASHTPWQLRMRRIRTAQEVDFYVPAVGLHWAAFPPGLGTHLLHCDIKALAGGPAREAATWLGACCAGILRGVTPLAAYTLRDTDRPDTYLHLAFLASRAEAEAAMAGAPAEGVTVTGFRAVTPPLPASDPIWREMPAEPGPA